MSKLLLTSKMKVKKGDEVLVISGKDKGKKGIVKTVLVKVSLLLVEGVNKYKKATKISQNNNENFVITERPISVSKVKVVKKAQKSVSKKGKKDIK